MRDNQFINYISSTNELNNSFVGIKIDSNTINFYYPESYRLSFSKPFKLRKELLSILNSFNLVSKKSDAINMTHDKAINNGLPSLNSMIWIVNDYVKNGIISIRDKSYQNKMENKILWKKTFETPPLISENGILFSKYVSEKYVNINGQIIDVHLYLIIYSIKIIGWLFGLSDKNLPLDKKIVYNKKLFINTIRNELEKSFEDSKILRYNHFLKLLNGIENDNANLSNLSYGVDKYELVFEKAIDRIFSSNVNKGMFLPSTNWYIKDNNRTYSNTKLEPDTIFIKDDFLIIIDSKYYRYNSTKSIKDLPNTSSILKQLAYANHANLVTDRKYKVFNIFILPANINQNQKKMNTRMNYLGKSTTTWRLNLASKDSVHAISIDTKTLIDNWLDLDRVEIQNDLIKLLSLNAS